jgi:hypothetical protein
LVTSIETGHVHVIRRTPEMTLSQLQGITFKNPTIQNFVQEANVHLLIPKGLNLPSNFMDVPESDWSRYRFFLLITDALNSVAVEFNGSDLNNLDRLTRLLHSQA